VAEVNRLVVAEQPAQLCGVILESAHTAARGRPVAVGAVDTAPGEQVSEEISELFHQVHTRPESFFEALLFRRQQCRGGVRVADVADEHEVLHIALGADGQRAATLRANQGGGLKGRAHAARDPHTASQSISCATEPAIRSNGRGVCTPAGHMGGLPILTATIAALPMAALVVARRGAVLAANTAAERMLGVTKVSEGIPTGDAWRAIRAAVVDTRGALPEPFETVDATGATLQIRLSALVVGHVDAVLVLAEGREEVNALTAQIRVLEEELRESRTDMDTANAELMAANAELHCANDELQGRLSELRDALEASRHKDDFLAMLAHELRNPLAPILSAMQVIRRHPENLEVVQRAREIVERQVRHQAQLLDDLLDVSRITRGLIKLRKGAIDAKSAVAAAVEATRPVIDARSHTLTVMLPDEPLRLKADPTRLTQMVTNLLDNAAKYTNPGGHIEVSAQRDGDDVVIRVRDTGIGIPADMQTRIFELFTQGDVPIARPLGGLGLGLSLVRSLTDMHGGTVQVASQGTGRGSEFTIRLPAGKAEGGSGAETPSPGTARHVLVIEDNADAREMLRMALELDGHRVETAPDGVSGVEVALRTTPDLVLIDIGLPELDGYAVARRLRASLGQRVTLVALTGYGQSEDRRRTSEAGFDAHLVKPVDPDVLSRALATGFRTAA
jgi:signal transduction histidine kinase/ActR/RegA family two-component response regulator